jgi:hypothetical protein
MQVGVIQESKSHQSEKDMFLAKFEENNGNICHYCAIYQGVRAQATVNNFADTKKSKREFQLGDMIHRTMQPFTQQF